jgi:hypothetical protein
MLAEPWGYARENIASLVLVEVWAARQRRPTLMVVSCCAREGRSDFYALDNRWPGFRVVNESSPRRTPRSRPAWMVLKMLVGLTNK